MSDVLLHVENLKEYYTARKGMLGKAESVRAVDGVTFDVRQGEVFGVVGESGCGKSTLGKVICKLLEPTEGKVCFEGEDIAQYSPKKMRAVRRKLQMVFQDPYASLNPRMSVRDILAEPLLIHHLAGGKKEVDEQVIGLLQKVGLDDYHANRYPHEFSGGQRQRIGLARALAVSPKMIIADEPVSALDVSIQSQVLNLMSDLKNDMGLTYLFISHDLSVVEHISDRVGVMYLGNFVEISDKEDLYRNPAHPYTQALLSAVPIPNPHKKKERVLLEGSIPSALNPPAGCKFHTRCKQCMEICKTEVPRWRDLTPTHHVCCHLYSENGGGNHEKTVE